MEDNLMKPQLKQFGVWDAGGYWEIFDRIEDAVSGGTVRDVYLLTAKKIGTYESVTRTTTRIVKVKPKLKKKSK